MLQNEMILASAGSGKTYRLTNRFVHLLAQDVAPERIIALTFTRKAAGEFLDEILKKLSRAAADPKTAAQLRRELDLPDFDSTRAAALLRRLTSRLHLLTLGTLDAFFNRILRCFPAEFGLSPGFEMLEEYRGAEVRRSVLTAIFADTAAHDEVLEAVKQATFGLDEKSLTRLIDDFVQAHHSIFLQAPEAALWGVEATIWGQSDRWTPDWKNVHAEIEALAGAIEAMEFAKDAQKMWNAFLELLRDSYPGRKRGDEAKTLLARLLGSYDDFRQGHPVELKLGRKLYTLEPAFSRRLGHLLDFFLYCEIAPHLERTRGIHRLLQAYEARYHDRVRRGGFLGFDDVQLLLSGRLDAGPDETSPALSLGLGADPARLNIDFRLDTRFDHWLLDEFQDTSLPQWQVIANLIDEVVQDTSGERSLFYVGDVKQAIFGWRGGDSRLFDDIYHHYNQDGAERIVEHTMEKSYRSGPALMEAVNRVFGCPDRLRSLFPDHSPFTSRWNAVWRDHRANDTSRRDFFQCLVLPKKDPAQPDTSLPERRLALVAEAVNRLELDRRPISCAVLVRKNDTARELADYLRAHSPVPVMVEGDTMVGRDHPAGSSFLSLLQATAHPGDTLAWQHLKMTPALRGLTPEQEREKRHQLLDQTLAILHESGFGGAWDNWLSLLEENGFEPDAFARRRIQQLRQACTQFDLTGSRSIPDFLRFASAFATRDTAVPGAVQIMTIHKSKGLGFDSVIVAEFEDARGLSITDPGQLSLVAHESGTGLNRRIDWVLSMPRKDVAETDSHLAEARFAKECDAAYEKLCLLYVALTRAKFGTLLICPEPGKAPSASKLITDALSGDPSEPRPLETETGLTATVIHQGGDPEWFTAPRFDPVTEFQEAPAKSPLVGSQRPFDFLPRAKPSGTAPAEGIIAGGAALADSEQALEAVEFGTRVHELFEHIDWLKPGWETELPAMLEAQIDPEDPLDTRARDEVLATLREPRITAVFQRATFGEGAVLWREKPFELVDDGSWVSGVFDRVVIDASHAWIYDFKTNRLDSEAGVEKLIKTYRPQLQLYQRALARLLKRPPETIQTHLIVTHHPTLTS